MDHTLQIATHDWVSDYDRYSRVGKVQTYKSDVLTVMQTVLVSKC